MNRPTERMSGMCCSMMLFGNRLYSSGDSTGVKKAPLLLLLAHGVVGYAIGLADQLLWNADHPEAKFSILSLKQAISPTTGTILHLYGHIWLICFFC